MQSILIKPAMWQIKAFTLLESLLTLAVTSFIILSFSTSINHVFANVEEQLFFISFEHLYRDTQKLSATTRQKIALQLGHKYISNGIDTLELPKGISLKHNQTLYFDEAGGNSSLEKLTFQTDTKTVTYQLYIGSGQYKKTSSDSLHSP